MELLVGSIFLTQGELTRFERSGIWSDDGADLLSIQQTVGGIFTYAPGGLPSLTSVTKPSRDTEYAVGRGLGQGGEPLVDQTATILAANPRGRVTPPVPVIDPPLMESDLEANIEADGNQLHAGPETDAELHRRLMLPRQRTILYAVARQNGKNFKWLESPRPGFATDLANGPIPLSCDVISATGEPHSIQVHYQFRTETSPCPTGMDKLVLSHRWEVSYGADEDHYVTRTIRGVIVFNGGVMRLQSVTPDALRNQFIHPIPLGMQRGVPDVTQSSDGLTLRYTVTDTDPTICFDPANSGATRALISEQVTYINPVTGILPTKDDD